jgi:4-hydroxy-tetrahydrodipicolinate synthase
LWSQWFQSVSVELRRVRVAEKRGIWAAVLTPVSGDNEPDTTRAVPYYLDLLERGCDGINLLGTTGEAMSWSVAQRIGFMEDIAASSLPMERFMVGTGAASLGDAIALTRCAFASGFSAALIMPPFFFRDASDDGIVAFFDQLFSEANPPPGGVLLYNFPGMSGITFHAGLVDRLIAEFPDIIAGMKDSSNDATLQTAVLARQPGMAVLPGSESDLMAAKARGVSGCISGSVALWPRLARAVFDREDVTQAETLTRARAVLDGLAFIPAVRHLTATLRDDLAWGRCMPPLLPLTQSQRNALDRAVEPFREYLR